MRTTKTKRSYDLRINFERYKDTYRQEIQKSISFIGQDLAFFTLVKVNKLLELIHKHLGATSHLKILDVGCGIGITDYYLTQHFKKLYGIDLSRGIVQKAAILNPKASYRHYQGKNLPYADNSMDVTFSICVMHHVVPEGWNHFTKEMIRVTKKGGLVVVFEHNPFNPLTQCAVSRCDLDEDANLLQMNNVKQLLGRDSSRVEDRGYILFTPFRGNLFSFLDRHLGWLPLGAQYYVAGKKTSG